MLSQSLKWVIESVRGLVSHSAQGREMNADGVDYWCSYGELRGDECPIFAGVCAWASLVETALIDQNPALSVRSSFLGAVDAFWVYGYGPHWTLDLVVSQISRDELNITELEVYDGFVEYLSETPEAMAFPGCSEPARLLEIIRDMTGHFPLERRRGINELAKAVTENEIFNHEATTLAAIAGWQTIIESNHSLRAGFLECLTTLTTRELIPGATWELITSELSREHMNDTELAAYETLLTTARSHGYH